MTGIELVKEVFPEATDQEAGYILWNHTGFPEFFRGDSAEAYFRQQLEEYKQNLITMAPDEIWHKTWDLPERQ